jgi:hypothetical protein
MSDPWIQDVATRLANTGNATDAQVAAMLRNPSNISMIVKYLTVVNKATGDINILKLGSF